MFLMQYSERDVMLKTVLWTASNAVQHMCGRLSDVMWICRCILNFCYETVDLHCLSFYIRIVLSVVLPELAK